MNDLDTLRPEVLDLLAGIEGEYPEAQTIRAKLLRLAKENTSRPANADEAIDLMATWINRAQKAEAELAALKARIAEAPRADGQRVFDLLCLPIEFDGTLALVKVEE